MTEEVIRKPLMTGHCGAHAKHETLSEQGMAAHSRCEDNGGGNRANPAKEFQPCPCKFHYHLTAEGEPAEVFECGGCGREIVEAWYWPLDEDGETRWTHIDGDGRALGENCEDTAPPKREPASKERDCTRCGDEFTPKGRERICPECRAAEIEEVDEFDDLNVDENGDPLDEADAMMAEFDDLDLDED